MDWSLEVEQPSFLTMGPVRMTVTGRKGGGEMQGAWDMEGSVVLLHQPWLPASGLLFLVEKKSISYLVMPLTQVTLTWNQMQS